MRISDWSSDVCSSDLGTRRASAKRTGSRAVGQCAAPARARHMTSAPNQPISSARSVRRKAKARRSSSPRCNTQAMTLHLAEISAAVAPGAHAVLLLDQRSEEHTSELQSLMRISYAVFCLKKKKQ